MFDVFKFSPPIKLYKFILHFFDILSSVFLLVFIFVIFSVYCTTTAKIVFLPTTLFFHICALLCQYFMHKESKDERLVTVQPYNIPFILRATKVSKRGFEAFCVHQT